MSKYSEIYILNMYLVVKITIISPFISSTQIENHMLLINSRHVTYMFLH